MWLFAAALRITWSGLLVTVSRSREFSYLAHRLQYADAGDLQAAIATWMGVARGLWPACVPPGP
jgi:hypothetical protein